MYKAFYGLNDKPFSQTLDLKYFYPGRSQQEALAFLSSKIKQKNTRHIVLTGEVGSGKTMLLRYFVGNLDRKYVVIQICYPAITGLQLLQMILLNIGVESTYEDIEQVRKKLNDYLVKLHRENKRVVLALDEAQNLKEDAVREAYRLSELKYGEEHLIRIIFSGLPEMLKKLNPLQHSGPAEIFHLENLSFEEVGGYIRQRLITAGRSDETIFPEEIIREINRLSNGAPRIINMICDALLTYGFFAHEKIITRATLKEAIDKLFYLDASEYTQPLQGLASYNVHIAEKRGKGRRVSAGDKKTAKPLKIKTETSINNKKAAASREEGSTVEYKLPLTVLILEKNARMRVHLENEFQRHGYNFQTIQRPEDLFGIMEHSVSGQLPVLVADTTFFFNATGDEDPQGKGILDRIQAKYAYIPLIMTSTLPLTAIRTKLFQRGLPFLLKKPDLSGIDMSEVTTQFNLFFHTLQNSIANIHYQFSQFYNMILKWNPKSTD